MKTFLTLFQPISQLCGIPHYFPLMAKKISPTPPLCRHVFQPKITSTCDRLPATPHLDSTTHKLFSSSPPNSNNLLLGLESLYNLLFSHTKNHLRAGAISKLTARIGIILSLKHLLNGRYSCPNTTHSQGS
jgi:hypothetical protein